MKNELTIIEKAREAAQVKAAELGYFALAGRIGRKHADDNELVLVEIKRLEAEARAER